MIRIHIAPVIRYRPRALLFLYRTVIFDFIQGLRICNTQNIQPQLKVMINYSHALKLFVGFAFLVGVATQVTVEQLDKATAQQCATHDWPLAKHQLHMAWCAANGYSTR